MDFKDLQEFKTAFTSSNFDLDENITVAGVPYHLRSSTNHNMIQMINNGYRGVVVYQTTEKIAEDSELKPWLLLTWKFDGNFIMSPQDIIPMTKARGAVSIHEADDNIIGSTVEVKFTNLSGSNLVKGKIDTGATICSLHADKFNINRSNGTVTFVSPQLSGNALTVPLTDQQAVKTADNGVEYRPVIELNIKINGKMLTNVKFNLNDRSHMEYPILVGKNALEQGKFMINPSLDEDDEIDWEEVQKTILEYNSTDEQTISTSEVKDEDIQELYKLLKESNITFSDIVRHIKTDVTENIMEGLD